MASSPPATLAEFKVRFLRDFQYGTGLDKVTDVDINNAFTDALAMYNPSLFSTDDGKLAFLYAAAHFVVANVQAAGGLLDTGAPRGQGINNVPADISSGGGVGGVSDSFVAPPDIVVANPNLRQFWTTDYGRRYIGMLVPRLRGAFGVVEGPLQVDSESGDVPFAEYS